MIYSYFNANFFFGIELARSSHDIFLFQRKYALELIQEIGLTAAKPVSCPLDSAVKLHKQGSDLFHDPTTYRRLIGHLVYLTTTRPIISFSVGLLSQFLDKPMIEHHQTALRVLKYVKLSSTLGLFFPNRQICQIISNSCLVFSSYFRS